MVLYQSFLKFHLEIIKSLPENIKLLVIYVYYLCIFLLVNLLEGVPQFLPINIMATNLLEDVMLACYFYLCVKFFSKQIKFIVCRFSSCTMPFFCTCFPIFMNLSWRYLLELKLKDKCLILFFKFKITIKFYCAAYFQSQTVKFSTFFYILFE